MPRLRGRRPCAGTTLAPHAHATPWARGTDMKVNYKETARGGLAVNVIEC